MQHYIRLRNSISIALILCLAILLNSCSGNSEKTISKQETTSLQDSFATQTEIADSIPGKLPANDSSLKARSGQILKAIKEKDYETFASFMHPVRGMRFASDGYIDTINHRKWSAAEFLMATSNEKIYFWGLSDGSGDSILLSLPAYFKKNVYPVDFLKAPQSSINKRLGQGNSLNNIHEIYPLAEFRENYFPGFDKKYGGMDWQSLRLVMEFYQGQYYLVAVVHDHWTT
ncbi:MAG: hypothetical protein ABIT96_05000 [Ferruginibacter sp.]